jgi:hypothetical protein
LALDVRSSFVDRFLRRHSILIADYSPDLIVSCVVALRRQTDCIGLRALRRPETLNALIIAIRIHAGTPALATPRGTR